MLLEQGEASTKAGEVHRRPERTEARCLDSTGCYTLPLVCFLRVLTEGIFANSAEAEP